MASRMVGSWLYHFPKWACVTAASCVTPKEMCDPNNVKVAQTILKQARGIVPWLRVSSWKSLAVPLLLRLRGSLSEGCWLHIRIWISVMRSVLPNHDVLVAASSADNTRAKPLLSLVRFCGRWYLPWGMCHSVVRFWHGPAGGSGRVKRH